MELLSFKANMLDWFLEIWDIFEAKRIAASEKVGGPVDEKMDPSVLPGWAYARALALWLKEDANKQVPLTRHSKMQRALLK